MHLCRVRLRLVEVESDLHPTQRSCPGAPGLVHGFVGLYGVPQFPSPMLRAFLARAMMGFAERYPSYEARLRNPRAMRLSR